MKSAALIATAAAAAVILTGAGCLSTASYHTAEPVQVGTTEMGLAAELDTIAGSDEGDEVVLTQPRVHVRRGVREGVDLGLAAGAFGSAFDANFAVATGESFTVSINPSQALALAHVFGGEGSGSPDSDLLATTIAGLLADLHLADNVTLTAGLKPGLVLESSSSATGRETESELFLGGSLGMKLGISETMHLFPEINIVRGLTNRSEAWPDGTIVKLGVGVGF